MHASIDPSPGKFASLPVRAMIAFIAGPLLLVCAYAGGFAFFAIVALISGLVLKEWYGLTRLRGASPHVGLGLAAGVFLNGAFLYDRLQAVVFLFFAELGIRLSMFSLHQFMTFVLLTFILLVLLAELFRAEGPALVNASVTIAGVMIIALPFGTLIYLRELFPYGFPVAKFFPGPLADQVQTVQIDRWGGFTVMAIFVSIWMCDTMAYFGGLTFGRHRLFERVSPGKSWEGAAFGFVAAVATMVVAQTWLLEYLSFGHAVAMGVMVGVGGQIGDLVESRFKRDAGVKDSSSLIPGHGGVYDRFDSLVFLSPILYLYVDFVVLS